MPRIERQQSHASQLLLSTYHFWGPNQSLTIQAEDLCYPFSGPENSLLPNSMASNRLKKLLTPRQSREEEIALVQQKLREDHEVIEQRVHDEIHALASLQIKDRRNRLGRIMSSIRGMINEQSEELQRLECEGRRFGIEWEEARRYQAGLYWRLSEAESMLSRGK